MNDGSDLRVLQGWNLQLPVHGSVELARRPAVRPITTRRYPAGRHEVDAQVNGVVAARAHFERALE